MRRDALLGHDLKHVFDFFRTSHIPALDGELAKNHGFGVELPLLDREAEWHHQSFVTQLLKAPSIGWYRIGAYDNSSETFTRSKFQNFLLSFASSRVDD
jgi:hypothetical protein